MKNRIYKYFFYEFIRYFTVVLFALTAIIWTIQAVNFLDLVVEDGHAFTIYLLYSSLTLPKILTKLIPFSFLIASILTILKFEKDNELIILWTSGLNKIHIVNLIFRISILIMFLQWIMAAIINPGTLNYSRAILKNSDLQFVPSLLKEKQFNDTVKGLTIFVDKKNIDGTYDGAPANPEITVISPNGGEDWEIGSSNLITWSSANAGNYVKIELFLSGSFYATIAPSTYNGGYYNWSIPAGHDPSSSYKVKITDAGESSTYDYSDSYFTLSGDQVITVDYLSGWNMVGLPLVVQDCNYS